MKGPLLSSTELSSTDNADADADADIANITTRPLRPNWKQWFAPYVILVWALPLSVVIAGLWTVHIAFSNADSTVAENYYNDGLAINREQEADRRAAVWGLRAILQAPEKPAAPWTLSVNGLPASVTALTLQLSHPTIASQDRHLSLQRTAAGRFAIPLALSSEADWYWQLTDASGQWRLRGQGFVHEGLQLLPETQ